MRSCDKHNPPFGNRSCGKRFGFGAYLVDNNNFGHVVFHCFDHHGVLQFRACHLHSSGGSNSRMRDVTISGYLIGSIYNHNTFLEFIREHPRDLAQFCCLSNPRPPKQHYTLPALYNVADNVDCPVNGATYSTGKPNHLALPVSYCRYSVQGALDTCAVVFTKLSHVADNIIQVFI